MLHVAAIYKVYGSRGSCHLLLEDVLDFTLLDIHLSIYILLLLATCGQTTDILLDEGNSHSLIDSTGEDE